MFIRFVIVLVVLAVGVYSAETAVTVENDVPHHEQLGHRFALHLFNVSATSPKGKTPSLRKEPASMKSILTTDYFVSRQRVNGDCSGDVIAEIGWRLGQCVQEDGYLPTRPYSPFLFECQESNDLVSFRKLFFDGSINGQAPGGCGFQTTFEEFNGEGEKCQTNQNYVPYRGYTSKTASSCGVAPTYTQLNSKGILTLYGANGDRGYKYVPFGVCQLFVDYQNTPPVTQQGQFGGTQYQTPIPDENTRFYYIKMVGCSDAGIVTVHAFADPACSRKLYKTAFDMNVDDKYEGFAYDPEVGIKGSSSCVNGFA